MTHPASPRSPIHSRSRSRAHTRPRPGLPPAARDGARDAMGDGDAWADGAEWDEWADDEPDFILEDGGLVLEAAERAQQPRLPSPRKLRRGALVVALIAVATLIVLGGPGSVAALLGPLAPAAQAHDLLRHLDQGQSWSTVDAPDAAGDNPSVRVVPANGAASMAYACWVDVSRPQLDLAPGPLSLASFDVRKRVWHTLPSPAANAVRCDFAPDTTDTRSALLILWNASLYDTHCPLPNLYLTHDQGASWAPVAWSPAALPSCDLTFRLVAGHLYVFSSDRLLAPAALPPHTAGQIVVSDDQGRTWRAADTGLAELASVEVVAFRPGGHILAQAEQQVPAASFSLWQTSDDGATWQYVGRLPGTDPRVYASSDPREPDGLWGPLYLASTTPIGAYAPAGTVYLAVAQVPATLALAPALPGALALHWQPLPPPPVPATLIGRPFGASLGDAAEGPAGALLYLQPVTNTTPYIILPQFRVWIWHPAAGAWTLGHYSIPPNATLQGVSWGGTPADMMTVWLTTFGGGLTAHVKVQMSGLTAAAG